MAFGKLYCMKDNPRTIPILAAAKANNIELELIETPPASTDEQYRKINKFGKVPTFVGSDGFILSECIAISIYITSQNEKTTLLGKTKQDYASILKWMSYANSDILFAYAGWLYPLIGKAPYNKRVIDDSIKKSSELVSVIDEWLLHHTFLVGERLTLADIFVASVLCTGFKFIFDKKWRAEFQNVTRWCETVYNCPTFSSVSGRIVFTDEIVKFQAPSKKDVVSKKQAGSKAAPDPKKEEEEGEELPPEPKPKHLLEALPKPTLDLDEWKRYYSNNDTPDALKWFWQNFKPEEYSLWKLDYKYNDELSQIFMSSNLIGGFFARLEASRKYIFGSASVYGQKNDSIIQGAFLIRGQDASAAFNVAPDWESYEFTKLDHTMEEDKQFVNDQWTWDKPITVNSKTYAWADGKVFK